MIEASHGCCLLLVALVAACGSTGENTPLLLGNVEREGPLRLLSFPEDGTSELPEREQRAVEALHEKLRKQPSPYAMATVLEGPYLRLPFHGGALLATGQGEFGGHLIWIDPRGATAHTNYSATPAVAIVADDSRALVFFGLSHMSCSGGDLLLVQAPRDDAPPEITLWCPLLGEPTQFRLRGEAVHFVMRDPCPPVLVPALTTFAALSAFAESTPAGAGHRTPFPGWVTRAGCSRERRRPPAPPRREPATRAGLRRVARTRHRPVAVHHRAAALG
jgi:hypothetical protein